MFMVRHEYKHQSSIITISAARKIVKDVLTRCFCVLDLQCESDQDLFRKAVPCVDYRCHIVHQSYVLDVGGILFSVATTIIKYTILILITK